MYFFQLKTIQSFTSIRENISIGVYKFYLNRCDERTFYITIHLQYANHFALCDLIFLIDRAEPFGAISLNHLYIDIQRFFEEHFNYQLLYSDEMQIAHIISAHPKFHESVQQYARKFPKYKLNLLKLANHPMQN